MTTDGIGLTGLNIGHYMGVQGSAWQDARRSFLREDHTIRLERVRECGSLGARDCSLGDGRAASGSQFPVPAIERDGPFHGVRQKVLDGLPFGIVLFKRGHD